MFSEESGETEKQRDNTLKGFDLLFNCRNRQESGFILPLSFFVLPTNHFLLSFSRH